MTSEQKLTTNIKVANNDLEILKQHFANCFDKNGKFDLEKFTKQINTENLELNTEKESYGLEWLGKSYARLLANDSAATLLREDEDHNAKDENKNAENLLIKGDNLEVLKHLVGAYREAVKIIYIDPPYNTGSDGFVYQDDKKFTVKELEEFAGIDEERAKRILSFTKSKSNSHSAWLTFMYPRLYIARQLLKDDGVIFISIDDNEVAQLRLLMDEIFGEENFVANFLWKKKGTTSNVKGSQVSSLIDYTLCFRKSIEGTIKQRITSKESRNYPHSDAEGNYRETIIEKKDSGSYKRDSMKFNIIGHKPRDGKRWQIGIDTAVELENKNRFIWDGEKVKLKIYDFEDDDTMSARPNLMFNHGSSDSAANELENYFEIEESFDNPKPTELIKEFIRITTISHSDLILDFFAGSGTTGDAVMQLNAEDGGNRKYILVQLPEAIDQKKNKAAYDFVIQLNEQNNVVNDNFNLIKVAEPQISYNQLPTIFEITKERLTRAAKKINAELDERVKKYQKEIDGLNSKLQTEDVAEELKTKKLEIETIKKLKRNNNFKIFETMPIWEDFYYTEEELKEESNLFNESKLTESDIKAILTTWKTYDEIVLTKELELIDLVGYTAFYGNQKLYLMNKGFTTDNLKTILEKIDLEDSFNPTSIIAFGYNFESKNLRELSESVKFFTNKKQINIDFVIRY